MQEVGKLFLFFGALLFVAGIFLVIVSKLFHGNISPPGDIVYRRENFTFYFPLTTCIVSSIVLTLIFNAFIRRR